MADKDASPKEVAATGNIKPNANQVRPEQVEGAKRPRIIKDCCSCVAITNVPAHIQNLGLAGWCCPKQDVDVGWTYFPRESTDLFKENYEESDTTFEHPLIGTAKFYNIVCEGMRLNDAAWYFPDPKPGYEEIKDHVTFREQWKKDILSFQAGPDDGVRIYHDYFG